MSTLRPVVLVSLFTLLPWSGAFAEGLAPCETALSLGPTRLLLQGRTMGQLGLDRGTLDDDERLLLRYYVEPFFFIGNDTAGLESAVSVYLPSKGPAKVELAEAERSIRGANSKVARVRGQQMGDRKVRAEERFVTVNHREAELPRELALALADRVRRGLESAPRPPKSDEGATTYTLHVGGDDAGTDDRCGHLRIYPSDFAERPLGRILATLRELTEAKGKTADAARKTLTELAGSS
ncbi:MAG: hypothetical protein AAF533_18505 [Acidobacteriota bacterium]